MMLHKSLLPALLAGAALGFARPPIATHWTIS